MTKIPINIEKIKVTNSHRTRNREETKYLIKLVERGQDWDRTIMCDRDDLLKFKKTIDEILASTPTSEVLDISEDQAKVVDEHYKTDALCKGCSYKLSHNCVQCLFATQSPLERQLFLELRRAYIPFELQYGIGTNGNNINVEQNKKSNNYIGVLTIADFYIEKRDVKLCVYTDGHTYHERTEDQATRDRKIDRKLQEFGYKALRYTGKNVREKPEEIIAEIKKWIGKS